ncbi:MAG: DNA-processing protein DprA [Actinomycetota bacterium]
MGKSTSALIDELGMGRDTAEQVARLLDAGAALAVELDRLEHQGLSVVTPFDDGYPTWLSQRLGKTAPPVLYVAGSSALLGSAGVAVAGSREVSDAGAHVARRVARLAARRGDALISGGAKGVDQVAMDAAAEAGGTVVGVLAEGLDRRLRQPDVRRAIARDEACLVSPYKPSAGFSVANAMARNKIVYALARITLVVTAEVERGGTWQGAVEALRRGFGRVAVWTGEGAGAGNAPLATRGAQPLDDLERLFDEAPAQPTEPAQQLRLGL